MIWIIWAQYPDRSGKPVFLGYTSYEAQAIALKELIEAASPSMEIEIAPLDHLRIEKGE